MLQVIQFWVKGGESGRAQRLDMVIEEAYYKQYQER